MKRKWLGLALAAVMACAGAATGTEYTDNSGNYPEGWNNGTNGGEGFGAWKIVEMSGSSGWAGHGLWNPSANSFTGTWDGKTQAFGMIGKGAGFSVTASRAFRKALAEGDSFQLDMGVNWDANIDGAHKGFVLTAGGKDILEINHGNYPGHIYLNDDDSCEVWNEAPNQELGEPLYPMTWKFTVKDATTLTISANSRKDAETVYEEDFEVETSAIDGFRLQSVEQDNQNEDRRQSYYDNFVLDVEGPLPDLRNLTLTEKSGTWAVTTADPVDLIFVVGRDTIEGEVAVKIASSDPFVVLSADEVLLEDGVDSIEVPATATLSTNANRAAITVEAVGYTSPAEPWEIKGPNYAWDADAWQLNAGQACTLWVNHWPSEYPDGDDGLISVTSSDSSVVEIALNEDWKTDEENPHTYASWKVTAVGGGKATANVSYAGVELGTWGFEVKGYGMELTAPKTTLYTNESVECTLTVTMPPDESGNFSLLAEPADRVEIDPAEQPLEESGQLVFTVTALQPGLVELKPNDPIGFGTVPTLILDIKERTDYGKYVAYDEASLYEEGTFDFASTGAGQEGFGAWQVVRSGAEFGNVIVNDNAAGMPDILSDDGKALALYSNGGDDPSYAVVRPFAKTLQPGQKASVEFVASEAGGSRVVRFVRIDGDSIYNRFEIWNTGGSIGINVDGVETTINWPNGLRRVEASIELAADGSNYMLELLGHNPGSDLLIDDIYQHSVNSDVGYWGGGIQGLYFEGTSTEGDLVFNRLAIEQVEEPTPPPPPAVTMALSGVWNPDEVGVPYEFTLTPSEVGAIGLVDLSLDGEGAELSETQVDLTEGAATFTFTLTGDTLPSGAEFKITASAQDVDVEDATYGITVWEPSTMLVVVNGQYEYDYVAGGTVEFWLYGTPKFVGQQANLDSGNENILAPPNPAVATVVPYYTESDEAKFAYTMTGIEEGQAWVHATKDEAEWGYAGITINGKAGGGGGGEVVSVKAISIKDGEMTLTLDGKGSQVFGATGLKDGGWDWQALDLAIIGDGTSVTLPMDAPTMMFKVECEEEEE